MCRSSTARYIRKDTLLMLKTKKKLQGKGKEIRLSKTKFV